MPVSVAALAACSLAMLAVSACNSSGESTEMGASRGVDSSEPSGTLMVFAAASLTDGFEALEKGFEARHPRVDVKFNFAGSQSLRTQIENGARAQVFASANEDHMEALSRGGLVEAHVPFIRNEMVVVTPADNTAAIQTFSDLPKAERLVLASATVPAGGYAAEILEKAGTSLGGEFVSRVNAAVVSRENDVRMTLQKVVLGEADAAMVYSTDAASAKGAVHTVTIPEEWNVTATYPIAVLTKAKRAHLGKLFIDYTRSPEGQDILSKHGFKKLDNKASTTVVARPTDSEGLSVE